MLEFVSVWFDYDFGCLAVDLRVASCLDLVYLRLIALFCFGFANLLILFCLFWFLLGLVAGDAFCCFCGFGFVGFAWFALWFVVLFELCALVRLRDLDCGLVGLWLVCLFVCFDFVLIFAVCCGFVLFSYLVLVLFLFTSCLQCSFASLA